MKANIMQMVLMVFFGLSAYGQAPDWKVTENDFEYTMSFVSFLNVDGETLAKTSDKIAAFVKGECRGVTDLTYVASTGNFYGYLTVFSNTNNEVVSFKIYDSSKDKVIDVDQKAVFKINTHHGDLFQAYSFAQPALSSEANIIGFELQGVNTNFLDINEDKVVLKVDPATELTAQNAVFQLSDGAKLYIGTDFQESGNSSIDFSSPVTFQVLSQDQSVVKNWTVIVQIATDVTVYKKDAVCYTNGVIKVVSTQNGAVFSLSRNETVVSNQHVLNGEILFTDLVPGIYLLKSDGVQKEVTIN